MVIALLLEIEWYLVLSIHFSLTKIWFFVHFFVTLTIVEGTLVGCADFCRDSDIQTSLMPLAAPSVREKQNKIWFSAHLFVPLAAMNSLINVRGRLIDLSQPMVMGILNVTPDSFYEGSRTMTEEAIAARARQIVGEGAGIIDVGACSTRPGGETVAEADELQRLELALNVVRGEVPEAIVSVDTFRPEVARRCVDEWGADIVNDVAPSTEMFDMVARLGVPYVLTSRAATLAEMLKELSGMVNELHSRGQKDVIIDPGFGFGKTTEENFAVLAHMEHLQWLELPVLVGVSRKSMIYKTLGVGPDEALTGTTAIHTIALQKGASILRVHDVREAVETIKIVKEVRELRS